MNRQEKLVMAALITLEQWQKTGKIANLKGVNVVFKEEAKSYVKEFSNKEIAECISALMQAGEVSFDLVMK